MSALHVPVPGGSGFSPPPHGREAFAPCAPARGPRRRPVLLLGVDAGLAWVLPVPSAPLGAARCSSPLALVHLSMQLGRELAVAEGRPGEAAFADAELLDAAARVVSSLLEELPELPLVGEPFGGDEGTD